MRLWGLPLLVAAMAAGPAPAGDAVFQYRAPAATAKQPSEAFLWIPPQAERIRGAVVAGMTLARAKFPLAVKVVAWQFGRGAPPLVKTAAPVEHIVLVEQ